MANYSLVVDSKFNPFSFERYIQPYQIYGQAYREVENTLSELETTASVWEKLADSAIDKDVYNKYKAFADELKRQANQLAKEGLNVISRRNMMNMRSQYSKEIVPIEEAYKIRQKQAEVQQQALLQDPDMMFDREAAITSLSDYINNPQLSYTPYSGKSLKAHVAQAVSNYKKRVLNGQANPRSILGNSYYEIERQLGLTPESILKVIQRADDADPELVKIVEDVIDMSGMRKWENYDALKDRIYAYATEGLWSGVGDTQYQTLENWRAKLAAQEAAEIRKENRIRGYGDNNPPVKGLVINPLNIYNVRELRKEEQLYKDNIKKFSKFFTQNKDGSYTMTKEGWKEYKKKVHILIASGPRSPSSGVYADSGFKRFIDSLGAGNAIGENYGSNQAAILGKVFKKYKEDSPESRTSRYDATRTTEYEYGLSDRQKNIMKSKILTALRGNNLEEVDYNSERRLFESTGKNKLSVESLNKDDFEVMDLRISPYGSTVMIKDNEGVVRRYRMPAGISTVNEDNRDRVLKAAQRYWQTAYYGEYVDDRGNTHRATLREILDAQKNFEEAIQEAYLFESYLGGTNDTETQTITPTSY